MTEAMAADAGQMWKALGPKGQFIVTAFGLALAGKIFLGGKGDAISHLKHHRHVEGMDVVVRNFERDRAASAALTEAFNALVKARRNTQVNSFARELMRHSEGRLRSANAEGIAQAIWEHHAPHREKLYSKRSSRKRK